MKKLCLIKEFSAHSISVDKEPQKQVQFGMETGIRQGLDVELLKSRGGIVPGRNFSNRFVLKRRIVPRKNCSNKNCSWKEFLCEELSLEKNCHWGKIVLREELPGGRIVPGKIALATILFLGKIASKKNCSWEELLGKNCP